jgi:alkaline phosphatase
MIGDGMGLAQISAARFKKGRLALEDMEFTGFSYTHSLEDFVTDSSASATALASGYLILNGWVSLHPDGTPTKTVLEYAEEKGMWTGIVATSTITHATPACMAAHVKSRGSEDDIALQLSQCDIEVILGGGWDKFLPIRATKIGEEIPVDPPIFAERPGGAAPLLVSGREILERASVLIADRHVGADGRAYGERKDKRDLIAEMEKRGYRFIRTAAELGLASSGAPAKIIGLFSSGAMPKVSDGRSPSLSAMSLGALRILSQSPKGFFLMIEGSQIDWGGHANDYEYAVNEAADFDDAVAAVQRFLRETGLERDTLVVVTADHETGGLALGGDGKLKLGTAPQWTTKGHTGIPVPVFACGPGARAFGGIQTHDGMGRKLIAHVCEGKAKFAYPAGKHTPGAKRDPEVSKF